MVISRSLAPRGGFLRREIEKKRGRQEEKEGVRFVWIAFEEESTFDERGGSYLCIMKLRYVGVERVKCERCDELSRQGKKKREMKRTGRSTKTKRNTRPDFPLLTSQTESTPTLPRHP